MEEDVKAKKKASLSPPRVHMGASRRKSNHFQPMDVDTESVREKTVHAAASSLSNNAALQTEVISLAALKLSSNESLTKKTTDEAAKAIASELLKSEEFFTSIKGAVAAAFFWNEDVIASVTCKITDSLARLQSKLDQANNEFNQNYGRFRSNIEKVHSDSGKVAQLFQAISKMKEQLLSFESRSDHLKQDTEYLLEEVPKIKELSVSFGKSAEDDMEFFRNEIIAKMESLKEKVPFEGKSNQNKQVHDVFRINNNSDWHGISLCTAKEISELLQNFKQITPKMLGEVLEKVNEISSIHQEFVNSKQKKRKNIVQDPPGE